jgi:signal transduction histidine kinase
MSSKWRERLTRTFGSRLALWYFVLFIVSVVVVLGVAYALLAASLRTRDREIIESTLVRYAAAYERRGLAGLDGAIAADRAAGLYEPLFVRVLTPGGGGAAFISVPAGWSAADLERLAASPFLGQEAWAELSAAGSDERLEVATARLSSGGLFQVGKSTRNRDELLGRFRGTASLLLVAVVLAALAGGATLTWSALRPLRNMTRAVGSILETGTVKARVPVGGTGDPLDDAAALMNRMLDRIEALIASLRGSLDNVAHDLRTPLTRLRATAETTLDRPRTAEEYRAALADVLEESERVTAMLDALMDIAEAETGAMTLRAEPTDLAALVRDAADLYADVAEEKGVRLDLELPAPLPIVADAARLRQAAANLIDNAVKYTQPGGRVTVSAAAGRDGATITVADTGVGISPRDLDHIWERLYRGDRSRSERGLGLGLSLVKAIVEAHGGRVEVESSSGEGSRFSMHLPAHAGPPPHDTDVMRG